MSLPVVAFSKFREANGLIFTAGHVHLKDGKLLEGTVAEKTHQVMKNLESVLDQAGVTFDNVVKVTIYLTDMSFYSEMNEVYGTYFKEPYPAREAVSVKALPLGADIEMSVVAAKGKL